METDAYNYTFIAILSIITLDNKAHSVAFYSCTFNPTELNYNIHDKELLTIFKEFQIWCHYLESSILSIDIVIDHKNLKYFLTTQVLICQQAR